MTVTVTFADDVQEKIFVADTVYVVVAVGVAVTELPVALLNEAAGVQAKVVGVCELKRILGRNVPGPTTELAVVPQTAALSLYDPYTEL